MTKELVKENLETTCKSCGEKIDEVWVCKLEVPHVTKYVYFCSRCQRCLGISEDKNPQSLLRSGDKTPPATLQF